MNDRPPLARARQRPWMRWLVAACVAVGTSTAWAGYETLYDGSEPLATLAVRGLDRTQALELDLTGLVRANVQQGRGPFSCCCASTCRESRSGL